jgi:DNA mismatch repair protein MutL
MNDIKVLSPQEAMKIAAGEVIERPAHIIKELLENSIDAQANAIVIQLVQAGKSEIVITDNGTGMTPQNLHKCFLQHATSKINSVHDLETINTFGFRGEALASVAAVSNVTITTRDKTHDTATTIGLAHGAVIFEEKTAHQIGTTIKITNLFDQIPARKKFLKTNETELNAIINIFQSVVLLESNIHFKLYHNNKLLYNCPPTKDHLDRAAQLWGPELAESLIQIPETISEDLVIWGSVTHAQYHRYNRNQIFVFVNNRWIKNSTIIRAILKGYKNILPAQKYPAAFLYIVLPQDKIDVNIHPKKEEIRFLNPRIVEKQVELLVAQALTDFVSKQTKFAPAIKFSYDSIVDKNPIAESVEFVSFDREPFQPKPFEFDTPSNSFDAKEIFFTNHQSKNNFQEQATDKPQTLYEQQAATISFEIQTALESEAVIIGQYQKTYILIEKDEHLIMVDQHAAHERIMYESLIENFNNTETIALLFPHVVQLSEEQISILEPYFHILQEHGISIEAFSDTEIIIQKTPIYLTSHALTPLIKSLILWIVTEKKFDPEKIHAHLRATIACRSSYQAGDRLNHEQMRNLITVLEKTKNNSSCPHGRPTIWVLSKKEIEKQFKRNYATQKQNVFDFV